MRSSSVSINLKKDQILIKLNENAEQENIVEYLDKKCTEIDCIINNKKKQLEILEQHKRSLIYEYITGKKEV